MTAKIIGSKCNNKIHYSQCINYENQNYAITKICKNTFKDNLSVKYVEFSNDSLL